MSSSFGRQRQRHKLSILLDKQGKRCVLHKRHALKGALSRHFGCFPVKPIQRSIILIFTRAENRLRQQSIFMQEEKLVVHFWFCLTDGHENFEKLRLNCSKWDPSPSMPSATTESSKTVSVQLFSLQ